MSNLSHTTQSVKLTKLRSEVLKLCATYDAYNNQGIPSWAVPHLKATTKRTITYLMKYNLVYYNVFGAIVTTPEGYDLYIERDGE
jgi:hypothetical protein